MAWSDDASDAVDGAFETFGAAGIYTAPAGTPLPCTVIAKSADHIVPFGEGRPFAEGTVIEVRISEVAAPIKGGTFMVGTSSFIVIGDPEQLDDLRLVWTCRVH